MKFGLVLLMLALSIGTLGLVATAALTESVEGNVLEEQEEAAVREAQALENWNERNEQLVMSAATAPVVDNGSAEEIGPYLLDVYRELPENERVHALYVDTSTGEVLEGAGNDVETLDEMAFPDATELDGVSDRSVERTDPYAMPDQLGLAFDHHAVVSYYVGAGAADDRALVITFDLSARSTEMPSSTDRETVVAIVDADGRIVGDDAYLGYEDDRESVSFLESYGNDDLLETARADSPGARTVDELPSETLRGAPYEFAPDGYVVGYHTTDDWTVLVHTSTASALGFVDTVDRFGTVVTAVGVLLIGLFGAVIGRNTATPIDRLTSKVGQMEEGDLDVQFETKRIDNIGRLYDDFASMRDELKAKITETEAARAEAERERERVQQLNDDLEQAAAAYGDVMEEAADGDLTVRMDPDVSDDETMRTIADDFNGMLIEIETTVAGLNRFATEVATASEEVTASSEEVRSASAQVSESIQEIADGAERQHESLRSVNSEMGGLSTTTEQIAASSNAVADVAERTADASREGREAATDAIDACDQLDRERASVVEEFEQLRDEVDQVDDLIDRIAEIAEQTNMLALNANIEASRSATGGDGGFGAVAAEVKELSRDVKTATEEIDRRLEGIKAQTDRSADEVERTSEEIERVTALVTNAGSSLEEIAEYAHETNDGIQEISAASEEQAASTEEVVAMVDEVATIAEETTAESETVAASAEEQTTAITEVSRSAGQLSQHAVALSEALDRFETDADGDAAVPSIDPAETQIGSDAEVGDVPVDDLVSEPVGDEDSDSKDDGSANSDSEIVDETFSFGE